MAARALWDDLNVPEVFLGKLARKRTPAKKQGKAPRKRAKAPTRPRRPPEERRQQIIDGAVTFFSEVGFEGGTRLLAKRLGVTQPLIFYFFPRKSDLLREVYNSVFMNRWRDEWEDEISDRRVPLRQRLIRFYQHYTATLFTPEWIRICLFAALRGCEIDQWWMTFFEERLVRKICVEIRHERRLPGPDVVPITPAETEAYWNFHGGIFNYGVRREVHRISPQLDLPTFIEVSVDSLLQGFPDAMQSMLCTKGGNA